MSGNGGMQTFFAGTTGNASQTVELSSATAAVGHADLQPRDRTLNC